jgi:hypothetical protein
VKLKPEKKPPANRKGFHTGEGFFLRTCGRRRSFRLLNESFGGLPQSSTAGLFRPTRHVAARSLLRFAPQIGENAHFCAFSFAQTPKATHKSWFSWLFSTKKP